MEPTTLTACVLAVLFVASLVRSTFGFGEALVAMPLLLFLIPAATATPLVALVSITMALGIVLQDWREVEFRSGPSLLIATALGMPIGIWWLKSADERLVKLLLAVLIATFSTFCLTRKKRAVQLPGWSVYVCGFVAGMLGTAYNTAGPPLVVFGTLQGWTPQRFRATLQGYFMTIGVLILPVHAVSGLWNPDVFRYFLLSLPALAVTIVIGRRLNRSLSDRLFTRLVHAGLLLIATAMVIHLLVPHG